MGLQIQAFEDENIFQVLQGEWDELLADSTQRTIFLTWEWQANWWAAYHESGNLWLMTIRTDEGRLVGIAPWFIDAQGGWVRSVGCVDVTDYLEMILREGYETAVLEALTAFVVEHQEKYAGLSFCNIPAASPLIERWQPILESAGFTVEVIQQEVCPVIELPATPEEYYENILNSKQAGEIRRKFRHAKTAEISWGFVQPDDDLDSALERFLALMRASSPEKASFLENSANLNFFLRVMPSVHACGWLKLSFIQVNGKDAAAYLSFDYNNQIQLYNSGQDHTVASKLSPGILLLMYIIQDAIREGRSHFDFLRGNEEYKYRAGGKDTAVMMLNATLN